MIDLLSFMFVMVYEIFVVVVWRLFCLGINWGRVVVLFCFGYEIVVIVICKGFSGSFLWRIIWFVVDFIFNERIVCWIVEYGGWVR